MSVLSGEEKILKLQWPPPAPPTSQLPRYFSPNRERSQTSPRDTGVTIWIPFSTLHPAPCITTSIMSVSISRINKMQMREWFSETNAKCLSYPMIVVMTLSQSCLIEGKIFTFLLRVILTQESRMLRSNFELSAQKSEWLGSVTDQVVGVRPACQGTHWHSTPKYKWGPSGNLNVMKVCRT